MAGSLAATLMACSLAAAAGGSARSVPFSGPCPAVRYHSAPHMKAQRLCMNLGVTTHGTQPGTFLFATPGGAFGTGVGIFRDNGQLVWWKRATSSMEDDVSVVRYHGHSYLAVWSGRATFKGPLGMGTVSLYNQHYERVGRITSGPPFGPDRIDAHEFRITPQGDALFGIYDPVATRFHGHRIEVYRYIVQKVSLVSGSHGIHTGRVLFRWDSLKHVPLSASRTPTPRGHAVWDYFHGNSIAQDSDGNLVISSRNTWGIYKVSARTGHIMWQVGAKGDQALPQPWSYQHDVVPLGGNRYSLFDDGGLVNGRTPVPGAHASRGLIVQVDPSHRPATVTLLCSYPHAPSIWAGFCGSVQLQDNGDVLIDWGEKPEITEYSPSGSPRMDLSMSEWSCRAVRSPWLGEPLTRPAVSARKSPSRTTVWASWNGSTQVRAWRVLAGARATRLGSVAAPRPEQGFETKIVVPRSYAFVAVQALNAVGHVLATSRPFSTAG